MPFQACSPADTTCTGRSNGGNRIINNPAITATKHTVQEKANRTPPAPIINPRIDGPTTRAPFTIELLSEIALSKSRGLSSDRERLARRHVEAHRHAIERGDNDDKQRRRDPAQAPAASKKHKSLGGLRRDDDRALRIRSATDPPQIENKLIGADPTAATTPSSNRNA